MLHSTFFRTVFGICGALVMSLPTPAEAQIVRRYAGGGVAVRAPFVRVDVGPYGATSVRAPFVAVDDPGTVYVGPGGRRLRRPMYAYGVMPPGAPGAPLVGQEQLALTAGRPLPTGEELAAMDLPTLVATMHELMATLQFELERFDKADGWQRYLALPEDALSGPGEEVSVRLDELQKQLARFDKVAGGGQFTKIAALPSFPATHEALRLLVEQFNEGGPAMVPPQDAEFSRDPGPVTERDESELLPAPPPSPEPRRGERSILKQR